MHTSYLVIIKIYREEGNGCREAKEGLKDCKCSS